MSGSTDFAARETKLDDRQKDLDDREAKLRNDDNVAFAESLVTDNKLLPAMKDTAVALLNALPAETQASFADGDDGKTVVAPLDATFRKFLSDLPEAISFDKVDIPADRTSSVAFASDGAEVDPDQLIIHNKALAFQSQHPGTDYIDAVKAVQ